MRPNPLLLGGTTEATALAAALHAAGIAGTFSYAGRVAAPRAQPLATRVGGFGGAEGLADWLRAERITHLIDATHPFAARMSANAIAASIATGVPLIALSRPPWRAGAQDRWRHVPDISAAVAALGPARRRVLLAIGRMHLDSFAAAPRHFYLLRLIDPPDGTPPLPDCAVVIDQGPFTREEDRALMRTHAIDLVVSKNSGGDGARAKLDAARDLGLEVLMIDRPALPDRTEVHDVQAVMDWLAHAGTDRGV